MAAIPRRDVFYDIADPTRRGIIDLISERSLNINEIAENFDISRSAVSQQLRILVECGVIEITQFGRERFCDVRPQRLDEVSGWLQAQQKVWRSRFGKLENHLKKSENSK
jgi:DNA-binding transcriptional ArsR family regulator